MRSGGLFAGYGGLDMAIAEVFGAEPAWFSEIEDAPSKILAHHWPDVPNHGDITQIDWDQVERVDILGGGFPCTDLSLAGRRAGLKPGTRSGLWSHFALGISKLRPQYVVIENVRGLLSAEAHSDVEPCPWCLGDGPGEPALRALGAVLGDLADLGYDAQWRGLRAADVGAPHGRYRIFVLASDTRRVGFERGRIAGDLGGAPTGRESEGLQRQRDRHAPRHSSTAATNSPSNRRHEGWTESAGELGGSNAAERRATSAHSPSARRDGRPGSDAQSYRRGERPGWLDTDRRIQWGQYAVAIERWERVLGRVAPVPTEPNSKGSQRLNPAFVEWMMGLPAGHVTAVPGVNRNAQLKALGNGVVPQQAIAALRHIYAAEHQEVA